MLTQTIDLLKNIFIFLQLKFLNFSLFLLEFFKDNTSGFFKFLFEKNIMGFAIATLVSTQISRLVSSFTEIFIDPIVKRLSADTVDSLKEWQFTIFGITLKIGLFLNTLFNFTVMFIIVYQVYLFSQNKDLSSVINWLRNTEEAVKESKTRVIISVNANS
jgi:large-conductance mechanosensitive channel